MQLLKIGLQITALVFVVNLSPVLYPWLASVNASVAVEFVLEIAVTVCSLLAEPNIKKDQYHHPWKLETIHIIYVKRQTTNFDHPLQKS